MIRATDLPPIEISDPDTVLQLSDTALKGLAVMVVELTGEIESTDQDVQPPSTV